MRPSMRRVRSGGRRTAVGRSWRRRPVGNRHDATVFAMHAHRIERARAISMTAASPAKRSKTQRNEKQSLSRSGNMSKLSPALKSLINAPFAKASTSPAPSNIVAVFERIGKHAHAHKVSQQTWVVLAAGPHLLVRDGNR